MRLANNTLDEVRRRVQREALDHRGREPDPLCRARELLALARERLSEDGDSRLRGLLAAGEVCDAWLAEERLRGFYEFTSAPLARDTLRQLARDLQSSAQPPEVNRLERTCGTGARPSPTGTPPKSPTPPPRPPTTSPERVKHAALGY